MARENYDVLINKELKTITLPEKKEIFDFIIFLMFKKEFGLGTFDITETLPYKKRIQKARKSAVEGNVSSYDEVFGNV